jgi:hypothetical protein
MLILEAVAASSSRRRWWVARPLPFAECCSQYSRHEQGGTSVAFFIRQVVIGQQVIESLPSVGGCSDL